jgi:hypothetical protein
MTDGRKSLLGNGEDITFRERNCINMFNQIPARGGTLLFTLCVGALLGEAAGEAEPASVASGS